MKSMLLAVTLCTTLALSSSAAVVRGDELFTTVPPAAWAAEDPADSLYTAAKRALNDRRYEASARMFEQIVSRYPRSEYAPDALYWKGFALYRNGDLDEAVAALEAQARRYPNASTREDGAALMITVKARLAQRGDSDARRDVDKVAEQSGRSCEDIDVQTAALMAVQQMDSERVMPLLKRVLARRDACSISLRKNALFILGQKRGDDREKILLDVAKTDPNAEVRKDAVFHLQQAKSEAAISALEDLLMNSDDVGVRKNALFSLSQNRTERGRKILRNLALADGVPSGLRKDAIFYLAQSRADDDVSWLREAYAKTPEPEQRANIMFHIAQRNNPETNKWLASVVKDTREPYEHRKNALFYLAQRRAEGLDELVSLYDANAPTQLRRDILFYISQRREPAALDKLITIAKSDPSADIRKDALFYIGQSKDPKALKALEDMVNP